MASSMELETQEAESLLHRGSSPTGRMGGAARIASAIGATVLLAIGGKTAWERPSASVRDVMQADGTQCSHEGGDCSDTRCCSNPSSRCWRKNPHWSSCNKTCSTNTKWDHKNNAWIETDGENDEDAWACEQLSPAHNGENCMHSKTCHAADSHCYRKNEHWASCNASCSKNMKWDHKNNGWTQIEDKNDEHVWDCHILSSAHDGENCMESKKCTNPHSHCFLKNEHWASCNATCSQNSIWNHDSNNWEKSDDPVWNCKKLSCVEDGDNCMDSRCCKNEGSTCFKKNDHWASCNTTCTASYKWTDNGWKDQGAGEKVWECEELLPEAEDDTPACDVSECKGCQGEQCTYCREDKERDCCLDNLCKGSQGEQVAKCKEDNLATCCEGKSGRCASDATPTCDTSECKNCQGEQCTYCREDKERDCCLEDKCKGSQGEQVAKCKEDNLDKCCEGKSGRCSTLKGSS